MRTTTTEHVQGNIRQPNPDSLFLGNRHNGARRRKAGRGHGRHALRDRPGPAIGGRQPDTEDYDTVFIGYPIWWDLAPRIIDTFIESHDLKGKTVIPFATSGGSGIAHSAEALRKSHPGPDWKEGRLLNRTDEKSLREWAESLQR